MKEIKHLWITAVIFILSSCLANAMTPDRKGCVDHPVFPTWMPGYSLSDCTTKDYDVFDFQTGKKDKTHVDGRRTKLTYRVEDRSKEPSGLAVVRNFENAIKRKIMGVANNKSILWRHTGSGQIYVWDLVGTNVIFKGLLETVSDLNWQIQ